MPGDAVEVEDGAEGDLEGGIVGVVGGEGDVGGGDVGDALYHALVVVGDDEVDVAQGDVVEA